MKVNFSIDFILGSSGNNSCKKTEDRCDENKNCTVQWNSKFNNASHEIKREIGSVENRPSMVRRSQEKRILQFDFLRQNSTDHIHNMIFEPTFDPGNLQLPQYPNYSSSIPTKAWSVNADRSTSSRNPANELNYDPRSNDPSATYMSTSLSSDDSEEEYKSSRGISPGYDDSRNVGKGNTKNARGNRIGRRLFTGVQILELENVFSTKQYLTRTERAYLSQKVNLTECQIKTWFQNRRTKEKRRGHSSEEDNVIVDDFRRHNTGNSFPKPTRIPGYGIQVRPTFGPPDKHLKAAIVDFLKRKSPAQNFASHS